eukprot:6472933-Amphidinium_carterae.1
MEPAKRWRRVHYFSVSMMAGSMFEKRLSFNEPCAPLVMASRHHLKCKALPDTCCLVLMNLHLEDVVAALALDALHGNTSTIATFLCARQCVVEVSPVAPEDV